LDPLLDSAQVGIIALEETLSQLLLPTYVQ
jgi:hypothetical protein